MYSIPDALLRDEFRQLLREEIEFTAIQHAGTMRKERKIADAMTQLLINLTDQFQRHIDHPDEPCIIKFTHQFQRQTCGGGKNYSHLQNALERNGFVIDHNYQRPTLKNKGLTKSIQIPERVLRIATEYLESLNLERVPLNDQVLIDWENPTLFDGVKVPSRVRVRVTEIEEMLREMERETLLDRWNLHLRYSLMREGWLDQTYQISPFGRLVGVGLSSLQATPKWMLRGMLKGCWEVDIHACAYALLPTIYNRRLHREEEFPLLRRYCRMREAIRQSISEDLGCEVALVKKAITAIAFGMKTNVNEYMDPEGIWVVPTLSQIFHSTTLAQRFADHPEVAGIWKEMKRIFADLSRETKIELDHLKPAQRVAYLYQHEEAGVLRTMIQCAGRKLVVPKHDAMVVNQMLRPEELQEIQAKVLEIHGYSIHLDQVLL